MASEILAGLQQPQKTISSKFLYDQLGSEWFEKICTLPEYYPTRTEISILKASRNALREILGEHCIIIEPGSGSSEKVQILLSHAQSPAAYLAIDIARDFLVSSATQLAEQYPDLPVEAIWADYTNLAKLAFH